VTKGADNLPLRRHDLQSQPDMADRVVSVRVGNRKHVSSPLFGTQQLPFDEALPLLLREGSGTVVINGT
jgi:hypothetical protein